LLVHEGFSKQGQILALKNLDAKDLNNLYLALFSPIIPYLVGINKLIIIPHRSLCYLPFEMLVTKLGATSSIENSLFYEYSSHKYLIHEFCISYAPSAYFLISSRNSIGIATKQKGDILAIANPDFSGSTIEIKKRALENEKLSNLEINKRILGGFEALPYSLQECKEIISNFKMPLLLAGKDAKKEKFLREAAFFQIIHLSTHGVFDESNPLCSGLVFSFDENTGSSGILYAYELFNIQMNCELITLSACETGLGQKIEWIRGEGVEGLSKMFLISGAKSLIVSFWAVVDESTANLMAEFYKKLKKEGLSKAEALRQAKISLMQKSKMSGGVSISYSHPFFWAPFVLIGNPN